VTVAIIVAGRRRLRLVPTYLHRECDVSLGGYRWSLDVIVMAVRG